MNKQATKKGDLNNNIAERHLKTSHTFDWDSATCVIYSTNYYQPITLESWFTNLERTALNRCQPLLHLTKVTLFGKTELNENSIVMHFKCVDNGSQRICDVIQSIVKTLTMFNKCLRMDEKCFSTHWQLFPTFDPNAAQNVENKGQRFTPL